MKKRVLLLSLILLVFSGCEEEIGKLLGTKEDSKKAQPMQMPPQMVQILVAKKSDTLLNFAYPARVVSDQDVSLRPKVSGTLLQKNFTAGQKVKKGDILFKIDPEVYQAEYNAKQANVQVAQASFNQARKDYLRLKSLYSKKAASQKAYDNASSAYEVARATLALAKASLESSKIKLNYTDVIAPFDGVVGDHLADIGDLISTNTPLVRLTAIDESFVEFFIPDTQILEANKNVNNNIWQNISKKVQISYEGVAVQGELTYIDKVVNPATGQMKAKAKFNNEKNILPVGSFANVSLDNFIQKNAFKIPQIALQQDLAQTIVLVATPLPKEAIEKMPKNMPPFMIPNATIKAVAIKIDYETNEFILTSTKELKEGDQIIMNNFKKIRPGDKVKVVGIYGQAPQQAEKK